MDQRLETLLQAAREQDGAECRWKAVEGTFRSFGFDVINYGVYDTVQKSPVAFLSNHTSDFLDYYVGLDSPYDDPWFGRLAAGDSELLYSYDARHRAFGSVNSRTEELLGELSHIGQFSSYYLSFANSDGGTIAGFNFGSGENRAGIKQLVTESDSTLRLAAAVALLMLPTCDQPEDAPENWVRMRAPDDVLSPREVEALKWLASGLRTERIGEKMGISNSTVRFHVHAARRKLKAKTREQAVAKAVAQRHIEI